MLRRIDDRLYRPASRRPLDNLSTNCDITVRNTVYRCSPIILDGYFATRRVHTKVCVHATTYSSTHYYNNNKEYNTRAGTPEVVYNTGSGVQHRKWCTTPEVVYNEMDKLSNAQL